MFLQSVTERSVEAMAILVMKPNEMPVRLPCRHSVQPEFL